MIFQLSDDNYKFYPLFIEHWSHYWARSMRSRLFPRIFSHPIADWFLDFSSDPRS